MIIWGGQRDAGVTGARYNPACDSWTPTSTLNAPAERSVHTAVWTGSEMIIWEGGGTSTGASGGRYDPVGASWPPTSTLAAPSALPGHTAVWSGSEMIVWGGRSPPIVSSDVNTGGRYDPATDSWTPTSTLNAPSARTGHTAVWSGSEMIV